MRSLPQGRMESKTKIESNKSPPLTIAAAEKKMMLMKRITEMIMNTINLKVSLNDSKTTMENKVSGRSN